MNEYEKKEIYRRVMFEFGADLQLFVLVEECAELIQAASKLRRVNNFPNILNFAEEIADVEIMIEQFKNYLGKEFIEDIEKHKEQKLIKLKSKYDKENE